MAGVHMVGAQLSLRGFEVAATGRGAKRTDLLAQRADGTSCGVQVKTRSRGDFHMGSTAFEPSQEGADEWFVLVNCPTPSAWPTFNVVPRNHVVAMMRVFNTISDERGKPWKRKALGEQEFANFATNGS